MSRITVIGIVGQSVFLPVEKVHVGGETVEAHSFHAEPGGKGFNQAVAAKRFGANVTFLAAIGNDGYDKTVKKVLDAEGVNSLLIEKDDATAYACIITDSTGKNRVTVYFGAELCPEDIEANKEVIGASDMVVIGNEVPNSVNEAVLRVTSERGIRVIMNPAPARKLTDFIKKNVDIFTPNEHETEGLEDKKNVIVTMGGKGCYIRELDVTIPATPDKPIDTTGAGDTFNGVLAAKLAEGCTLTEAVTIANRASGKSVTRRGAVSSIPYAYEIL